MAYCVYKHTCPNGKAYIGITGRDPESRWASGHGYDSQVFGRAVKKYGWKNIKHEILLSGLSQEEAESAEIELIEKYGTFNPGNGYNMDKGGKGSSGRVATDEMRSQMRDRTLKMWENPEIKEKLVEHLREISKKNVGKKRSQEHTQKLLEKLSIKIDQYDKQGNFIKTFNSAMDAARSIGKSTNATIISCCKGKKKSYFGFIWKYHGEELSHEEIERINTKELHKKEVIMCDSEWNELERFESLHEADRKLGISFKAIQSACKTGRHCRGYRWKYANVV